MDWVYTNSSCASAATHQLVEEFLLSSDAFAEGLFDQIVLDVVVGSGLVLLTGYYYLFVQPKPVSFFCWFSCWCFWLSRILFLSMRIFLVVGGGEFLSSFGLGDAGVQHEPGVHGRSADKVDVAKHVKQANAGGDKVGGHGPERAQRQIVSPMNDLDPQVGEQKDRGKEEVEGNQKEGFSAHDHVDPSRGEETLKILFVDGPRHGKGHGVGGNGSHVHLGGKDHEGVGGRAEVGQGGVLAEVFGSEGIGQEAPTSHGGAQEQTANDHPHLGVPKGVLLEVGLSFHGKHGGLLEGRLVVDGNAPISPARGPPEEQGSLPKDTGLFGILIGCPIITHTRVDRPIGKERCPC